MLYFEKLIFCEYIKRTYINISQGESITRIFIVINLKKNENAEATDENQLRRNDGSA